MMMLTNILTIGICILFTKSSTAQKVANEKIFQFCPMANDTLVLIMIQKESLWTLRVLPENKFSLRVVSFETGNYIAAGRIVTFGNEIRLQFSPIQDSTSRYKDFRFVRFDDIVMTKFRNCFRGDTNSRFIVRD